VASTLAVMTQVPSTPTVVEATGAARTRSCTRLSGAPDPPTTSADAEAPGPSPPTTSPTRMLLICAGTTVFVGVEGGVAVG
jgi:hypothetical protein